MKELSEEILIDAYETVLTNPGCDFERFRIVMEVECEDSVADEFGFDKCDQDDGLAEVWDAEYTDDKHKDTMPIRCWADRLGEELGK